MIERHGPVGILNKVEHPTHFIGDARIRNFIENPYRPVTFDHLMVSPQNSRRMLYELIDTEIANAQQNKPCGITLKINNLVDGLFCCALAISVSISSYSIRREFCGETIR